MSTTNKYPPGRMCCELSSDLLYPNAEQIAGVNSSIQFAGASTKHSTTMLRHSVTTTMAGERPS